jgi:hypothetical protein
MMDMPCDVLELLASTIRMITAHGTKESLLFWQVENSRGPELIV